MDVCVCVCMCACMHACVNTFILPILHRLAVVEFIFFRFAINTVIVVNTWSYSFTVRLRTVKYDYIYKCEMALNVCTL